MPISENIQNVLDQMRQAAGRSQKAAAKADLLPVSKYVDCGRIQEAYDAGIRMFGENRVQEWQQKKDLLPRDIEWHIIGHLQTNKVKAIAGQTALIHSLDRDDLAAEIIRQAEKHQISRVDCLVQVNSTGEAAKGGLAPEQVLPFFERWMNRSPLHLRGLMTMGPLEGDEEAIRRAFRLTRELFDRLRDVYPGAGLDTLSMGMSGDFMIAVEEGSTLVRVGSKIFGARPAV